MEAATRPFHLFEAFGVELEYMIVDAASLDIRPCADQLIHAVGNRKNSRARGEFAWSNELVAHVVEIKTATPVASLEGLANGFHAEIQEIERQLVPLGCRLLPGGMHPWMDPLRETELWPHEDEEVYAAFDRIFNCRGHGWSNLQSCHLNLSFSGDEEFRRLHSAIRLVLPLIPALTASSPIADGRHTEWLDYRLKAYAENCARFPSISARLIPDVIRSESEYVERVYRPIAADLKPLDSQDALDPVWVNARGAIARFDRGAIEIRLIDTQECPSQDLALLQYVIAMLRWLVAEKPASLQAQESVSTNELADLLTQTTREGLAAMVTSDALAQAFGLEKFSPRPLREILSNLPLDTQLSTRAAVNQILSRGCLAERIRSRLAGTDRDIPRRELKPVFQMLADGLRQNHCFEHDP